MANGSVEQILDGRNARFKFPLLDQNIGTKKYALFDDRSLITAAKTPSWCVLRVMHLDAPIQDNDPEQQNEINCKQNTDGRPDAKLHPNRRGALNHHICR